MIFGTQINADKLKMMNVEQYPRLEGKQMVMVLNPKPGTAKAGKSEKSAPKAAPKPEPKMEPKTKTAT